MSKHNFVSHGQQRVPHVVFNLGNELDSVHEQELKQLFADIGIAYVDSTPLRVCKHQRILIHKTFKGIAQRGKCSMG